MKRRRATAGFTLLELAITMALLIPVLAVAMTTVGLVVRTRNTTNQLAEVVQRNRVIFQRLGRLLRPALLSSCEVRADQADVDYYNTLAAAELALDPAATPFTTTVGAWIAPRTPPVPHQAVQFQAASGELAMNASALTPMRKIEFIREAGELANGVDDDGDGFVDEGDLWVQSDGGDVIVGRNVEECGLLLTSKTLVVTLTLANKDSAGNVFRARLSRTFYPRNN